MLEQSLAKPESSAPRPGGAKSSDELLVIIDQSNQWVPINLPEFWRFRELLYLLIWRDIKVRYKQTVLGALWVVIQPLLMTLIFTLFLGKLARVPSAGIPYTLLVYSGLMAWTFFASAITNSGNSLVGNSNLITKIYFPRAMIPAAAVGARLLDLFIAFLIMVGMLVVYGVTPSLKIFLLPVPVLILVLLALGLGLWTSALNVKYRDVGIMIPVLVQLWMFVSPVVYPLDLVPQRWQWLYSLNPMVGPIEAFRAALFDRPIRWSALAVSAAVTVVILVYALYAFRRMERLFADSV